MCQMMLKTRRTTVKTTRLNGAISQHKGETCAADILRLDYLSNLVVSRPRGQTDFFVTEDV